MKEVVFYDMTPGALVRRTDVSEELVAFIFIVTRHQGGGSPPISTPLHAALKLRAPCCKQFLT
jgi:hypothetical protein